MSSNIDRDQTFLGLPLLKVRNVLKAWRMSVDRCARKLGSMIDEPKMKLGQIGSGTANG